MKRLDSTDTKISSTSAASSSLNRSSRSSTGPRDLARGLVGASRPSPRSSPSSPPTPPTPLDSTSAAASTEVSLDQADSPLAGAGNAHAKGLTPAPGPSPSTASPSTAPAVSSASAPPSPSPRVVCGSGAVARLPMELGRLHLSSPLIVSSPSRIALARRIQALVPNLSSSILDSAVVNVPAHVVDDALDRISGRDVVISVGGASAVGLAKVIGSRKGIPHICIPTTYSASEMMPQLLDASPARHGSRRHGHGASRRRTGHKSTVRDPNILPTIIIYDQELTMSPPRRVSAPSDSVAMARSTQSSTHPSGDETSQWSYIHLPGV